MNIIRVDSLDIKELDVYTKYNERELLHCYEPDLGVFIAETAEVIGRAVSAGYMPLSFLIEEKLLKSREAELITRFPDVAVYSAPLDVINKITGFNLTRGMLCVMRRLPSPEYDDFITGAKNIVYLEDIENPTNVGALFRDAAALGADRVILSGDCADPLYRRAARVSMGTVFQIPWLMLSSSDNIFPALKNDGYKIISMALTDDSVSIKEPVLDSTGKCVVVFGNEYNGVSADTLNLSDHVVKIPMYNGVDSLNVASAGAVACYRFFS